MDQLEALKQENESVKSVLKNTNAEKTAIDQICMNNIRENVTLRTQMIMLQNDLVEKVREIEELKSKLDKFENSNVVDLVEESVA